MDKEKLSLDLTRHFDDIQRYSDGVSDDAAVEYSDTEKEIFALLALIFLSLGDGKMKDDYQSNKKLDTLKAKIKEEREKSDSAVLSTLSEQSKEELQTQGEWLGGLSRLTSGKGFKITEKDIEKMIRYGKYNGLTMKQIVDKVTSGDIQRIYDAIADGLDKNLPLSEIKKNVTTELKKTRRFIKSEVDTIVNGVANDAVLYFSASFGVNLQYSAVMDSSVCEECAELDGTIYESGSDDIPYLPRHISCRCQFIPVLDGVTEDVSPAPFSEYLASLSPSEQRHRIGSANYAEVKSGDKKIDGYIHPSKVSRLSLKEIRERDKSNLSDLALA